MFIDMSYFDIIYGHELRNFSELFPMLSLHYALESIGLVASHLHALPQINKQVKESDLNYRFFNSFKIFKGV